MRVPEGTNKNRFAFDDGNLKEQATLGERNHTPLALHPCSTGRSCSTCCSMLAQPLQHITTQPTFKIEAKTEASLARSTKQHGCIMAE